MSVYSQLDLVSCVMLTSYDEATRYYHRYMQLTKILNSHLIYVKLDEYAFRAGSQGGLASMFDFYLTKQQAVTLY